METPLSEEKKPIDIGYTDESLEQIVKKAVQDDYDVWLEALSVPFDQIRGYRNYVNQEAIYRTHQGVKGNEFERVMVIESDQEAGGFFLHMSSFWAQKSPQLGR